MVVKSKLEWQQLIGHTFCLKSSCADCLVSWEGDDCLLTDIYFADNEEVTWDEVKGFIELHSDLGDLIEKELDP